MPLHKTAWRGVPFTAGVILLALLAPRQIEAQAKIVGSYTLP
jgi:hypothetical protein